MRKTKIIIERPGFFFGQVLFEGFAYITDLTI